MRTVAASPSSPRRSAGWPRARRARPATSSVIVDAVHAETNATVMAMEKGAKQMQQGLVLLDQVTDATDQVRLTTQQQRSATAQVVETMEQLTDASRQVAITAQQIAGAAGNLADLAGNLETTADRQRAAGRRAEPMRALLMPLGDEWYAVEAERVKEVDRRTAPDPPARAPVRAAGCDQPARRGRAAARHRRRCSVSRSPGPRRSRSSCTRPTGRLR